MRNVVLVALALACGCGGTETGNPFEGDTRVHAHSSEAGRIAVLADGSQARIEQVWLGAGPIAMLGDDCATAVASMPAPATDSDHAQPGAEELRYQLVEEPLCAIAVPLVQVTAVPPGAPLELAGHSVLIIGVRLGDGTPLGTPFMIRTARTGTIYIPELVAGTHFTITADQPATFLGLDVAAWITTGIDLAGATPMAGGIVIEAGVDDTRLAAFEAALPGGFELYDDPDASGSAGPGEAKLAKGTELR